MKARQDLKLILFHILGARAKRKRLFDQEFVSKTEIIAFYRILKIKVKIETLLRVLRKEAERGHKIYMFEGEFNDNWLIRYSHYRGQYIVNTLKVICKEHLKPQPCEVCHPYSKFITADKVMKK